MTPAHTDSPLRRSEAFREGQQNVAINDDEEERRQARRRTLMSGNSTGESSVFEENETLKKCLEIYNGNKLSKENAWSLSLIDTLSALLERHHKSLNNFKIAGSSLEASSKVYSLRVDSIHSDVLRMSAGLNAQKYKEKQIEDDDEDAEDEVATGGDGSNDPNASAAGVERAEKQPAKQKTKKQRKNISTVTKNKDTLNARLDTVPLQDPVFGKLNSTVGSINSSNRLMNNILLTTDSELRLRTTFLIWDSNSLPNCDYTEDVDMNTDNDSELVACDRLFKIKRPEDIQLRPTHSGYVISDTPEEKEDDTRHSRVNSMCTDSDDEPPGCQDVMGEDIMAPFATNNEVGMAFDINAECEPLPTLSQHVPIMDVNYEELDELTTEERTAINKCRGLRKAAIVIEDLRPVDSTSKLEYSYRPLDKISQFWAGPSHWKFKRARSARSTFGAQQNDANVRHLNQRTKRAHKALQKTKSKQLIFGEFHDELFIKYDENFKSRKANIQKKWDQKKLKLPVDLRLDPDRFFYYTLAPGLPVHIKGAERPSMTICNGSEQDTLQNNMVNIATDDHFGGGGVGDDDDDIQHDNMPLDNDHHTLNNSQVCAGMDVDLNNGDNFLPNSENANDTILEIATDFEGAPTQVTKIVVPFAKRAKVIDMKNLKHTCTVLLKEQLKRPIVATALPQHPIPKEEQYEGGIASFHTVYEELPEKLTQSMKEGLSTSIAFYSVLHLANELSLRLIPQQDLKDFKIRKVAG